MSRPGTATLLDFVEHYVAAAERFAAALPVTPPDARVPWCPSWTSYDLACHLGNVHAWAATIVETGRRAAGQNDEPRSRRPRVVGEWYAGKAEDLYQVLRAADPDAPCWNFAFGEGRVGFWLRRQAHETTVHGLDLLACTGGTADVPVELAADGVDEVLTVFLKRMHDRGHPAVLTAPVCLVATDADRAWTVTPRAVVRGPGDGGVPVQPRGSSAESAPALVDGPPLVVERRHPAADQVVGSAAVLYRLLWRRAERQALEDSGELRITGDRERVEAFLGSRLVP